MPEPEAQFPDPSWRGTPWLDAGLLVFALIALAQPLLALPALLFVFLWFLVRKRGARLGHWLLAGAALISFAAFGRFLLEEAIFGIVEAGERAVEKSMVARVRQVVFAEDLIRSQALIDPDQDRAGSAALIEELSGLRALRSGRAIDAPMFAPQHARVRITPLGPALEFNRHLIAICLPTAEGWSADPAAAFDEEKAERSYRIYAWPIDGVGSTIFADQDEAIALTAHSYDAERPPPCEAIDQGALDFRPFKGPRPGAPKTSRALPDAVRSAGV